ncbi:MAG TPA: hypothetical protein VHI51_08320 [Ktedonobacterales bacterium]|jgi:hypothetical protein|nr:hypothetical protein [Ktedonobacterales bacterium]
MRSSLLPAPSEQSLSAITAEGATLPVIRAAGFEARVNAYIVGATEHARRQTPGSGNAVPASRSPDCSGGATDLWYLSLVAPRGHGTTLRAIWANLVSNTHHAVWLEGVGMVALGHQRLDFSGSAGLGYPIHWTYRQAVVPPSREVQAVLESDLLTCYDPLLAPVVTRAPRTPRGKPGAQRASARTRPERAAATLTTAASATSDQENEARARETRPLFLLLARAGATEQPDGTTHGTVRSGDDTTLAQLHLRFLATRIPWLPYYPAWAEYLWRRALTRGEAEPLQVWSYGAAHDGASGNLPSEPAVPLKATVPYLTAAYLCRPDPLALTADPSHAIAAGMFSATPPITTADERAA